MTADQATAEVFYAAFKAMAQKQREAFIEKVVGDPRLREELLDLALIQAAKRVKGKAIPAQDYFARRRRQG